MPNASNRNLTTLSHLYTNPLPHRRDFVRENKEYVRDMSKQQITKDKPQIDGYEPFSSSADQISSRSSNFTEAMKVHTSKVASSTPFQTKPRSPGRKPIWTNRRTTQKANKIDAPEPPKPPKLLPQSTKAKVINVNKTKVSSTTSSTIAVQTDEINDEIYLYNALKKCASPAFKSALKAKYVQKERDLQNRQATSVSQELTMPLDDSCELGDHYENVNREHVREITCDAKSIAGKTNIQRAESVQTDYTQNSVRSVVNNQPSRDIYNSLRRQHSQDTACNLNVVTMPTDGVSHCTPSKCTNCPVGYHLLNDQERENIKTKLLNHEAMLIKQLNSFPLAIETLRVRQSKTRIEKELSILEQNLRKLTKRKVYAKIHE